MVGSSTGKENFRQTEDKSMSLFKGHTLPFGKQQKAGQHGDFIKELRDVNANAGSTGTVTQGSGFVEVDIATDATYLGKVWLKWTRAALADATAYSAGAPWFRDNEFISSIRQAELRQGNVVVWRGYQDDFFRWYRNLPVAVRAAIAPGMGADMSFAQRRIRGAASTPVEGYLPLPWILQNLKGVLPVCALGDKLVLRVEFEALNKCVRGVAPTGGSISGFGIRQENYHLPAPQHDMVAASSRSTHELAPSANGWSIPFLKYNRQGDVTLTGLSPTADATNSIQLTSIKCPIFGVDVTIRYPEHVLAPAFTKVVDDYNLPVSDINLLSNNQELIVDETYYPYASHVAYVSSQKRLDNAIMFPEASPGIVRNIAPLCAPEVFAANMRCDFSNNRMASLYNDLTLRITTSPTLTKSSYSFYINDGGCIAGPLAISTPTSLLVSIVAYGPDTLFLGSKGNLRSLYAVN